MQMSISSPWQGKNHLRSLGKHVRKQSLVASHPRKKGARSTKLPRHKTNDSGADEPRVLPLIFHLQNPDPSPCPLFPPHNARTCHTNQRRVTPDLVSTRPLMLELSHLQTHRPPITSQPARLASLPLRNTTRLRHLLPPHPSAPHLDTFNTHPTPNLPPTIHPLRTPRNSLQPRQLRFQPQSPNPHNNRPRHTRRTTNPRRIARDQSRDLNSAPSQTRRAKQSYPSSYSKNEAIIPII